MGSLTLAAIAFAVVLVGGAIGLELQRVLPESYTTGGPRDMTGAVVSDVKSRPVSRLSFAPTDLDDCHVTLAGELYGIAKQVD